MSSDTTAADERSKYETFLRRTKKRVRRDATDHDRSLIGQGQTALLDRRDALLELKSRVNKAIRSRVDLLDGEERALRALSKEKKREELVDAHVILDSRQGGVIIVRDAETGEVLAGPTPLSASQREVFAETKTQTNLFDKSADVVAANEELAKKLNLMEYLADDPPASTSERVAAALEAGDLPDDLKSQLMDFLAEDEADREGREKEGSAPKAKKEKTPSEPKKRGRPKKDKSEPAKAAPPAPATTDEQPGPAVAERDETLPKKPPSAKKPMSDEPEEGERIPIAEEGDAPLSRARQDLVSSLASYVRDHDDEEGDAEEEPEMAAPEAAEEPADEPSEPDGLSTEPVDDGDVDAIPEPAHDIDETEPGEPDEASSPSDETPVDVEPAADVSEPEEPAADDDEIPDYGSPDVAPEPAPKRIVDREDEPPADDEPSEPAPSEATDPEDAQPSPAPEPEPKPVEPPALSPEPEPVKAAAEPPPVAVAAKPKKKRDADATASATPPPAAPAPDLTEANNWGMPAQQAARLVPAAEAAVRNVVFYSPIVVSQVEAESGTPLKAESMCRALPFIFRDLAAKGKFSARSLPNGDVAYYLIVPHPRGKNLTPDRVEASIQAYLAGERAPKALKK